jgi:hypothetical protein
MFYVYTIYTRPLSSQAQYSWSCPIICSLCYNSSLDTWPPPSLSLLYFLCWASPCHILWTPFSWFCITSACCLSRPVCLGVVPLLEQVTRFYISEWQSEVDQMGNTYPIVLLCLLPRANQQETMLCPIVASLPTPWKRLPWTVLLTCCLATGACNNIKWYRYGLPQNIILIRVV